MMRTSLRPRGAQWKQLKERGFALAYWRQSEAGRWEKQA